MPFIISETEKYYNNAINISPDDCIKMNENSIAYDFSIVLTDYEGHPLKDKNALERSTLFLSLYLGCNRHSISAYIHQVFCISSPEFH